MEIQANTIASTMAKRVGANYRLLHVPDLLSGDAYQSLALDSNIGEIVQTIRSSRIIVHGIGDAIEMTRRRKLDEATVSEIQGEGAVAESFGYYFNEEGQVVHTMLTMGLRLEDIIRTESHRYCRRQTQGQSHSCHAAFRAGEYSRHGRGCRSRNRQGN